MDAADKSRQLLQQTQQGIYDRTQGAKGIASGAINTGYDQAGNALGTGYDTAGNAINTGAGSALGYVGQGTQGAVGALTANGGAYAPVSNLAASYGKGAGLYADALGVNGPEGNTRASSAFTSNPAYEYTLNAGIDAVNRRANAAGMLQGGNANRDAIDYAHNLSNQDYGSWLDRLGGYNSLQLGATTGAAAGNQSNNQSVASLLNNEGAAKAGIAAGQGNSLADLARSYYGSLGANDVNRGTALAGNETGANQLITQSDLNLVPQQAKTYSDAAAAQMAGSANTIGLGLNLAKLAAGAAGGAGGGFPGISGNPMWNSSLPTGSFTGA